LGFVTIILVLLLSIVGIWFFNRVYDLQRQTISELTAKNSELQTQVFDLYENNSNLQFQVNDLSEDMANALNLTKKVGIGSCNVCPQHAGEKYGAGYFHNNYAGYVAVSLTATGLSNGGYAIIEIDYAYNDQLFNFTKTYDADLLGNSVGGTFIAPVLPANVSVWIGNANSTSEPTMMYEVNYYF
jgi:hypothetical protein